MTIDELKAHYLFARLSDQQKGYVLARCLGKTRDDAAREAYPEAVGKSIEVMGGRLEKRQDVTWLIKEFKGGNPPSVEDAQRIAWNIVQSSQDRDTQLKALAYLADISGWRKRPEVMPPPTPTIAEREIDGDAEFEIDR